MLRPTSTWNLTILLFCSLLLVKSSGEETMAEKDPPGLPSHGKMPRGAGISEVIRSANGGNIGRTHMIHSHTGEEMIVDGMDMVLTMEQYARLYGHHFDHTDPEPAKTTTTTTPQASKSDTAK